MKKILIILSLFFGTAHANDVRESRVILLSYPRSGNTWSRYSIEYLTKRPTCHIAYYTNEEEISAANFPLGNIYDIGIDPNREAVLKMHHLNRKHANPDEDYLILILRNYKECVVREMRSPRKALNILKAHQNRYYQNIRDFHEWPEERRLLVYYEDLITNPEEEYRKLTAFFGEGSERIEPFIEEFAIHKNNCIEFYEKLTGKSTTKGKKMLFHSNRFSPKKRLLLDQLAQKHLGDLFSIYLDRYVE